MNVKILSETENKLFNRKELELEVKHEKEGTPSKSSMYKFLSVKTKTPSEQIILKQFKTPFGSNTAKGLAYIYKNSEIMKKIEIGKLLERRNKVLKADSEKEVVVKEETQPIETSKEETSEQSSEISEEEKSE